MIYKIFTKYKKFIKLKISLTKIGPFYKYKNYNSLNIIN